MQGWSSEVPSRYQGSVGALLVLGALAACGIAALKGLGIVMLPSVLSYRFLPFYLILMTLFLIFNHNSCIFSYYYCLLACIICCEINLLMLNFNDSIRASFALVCLQSIIFLLYSFRISCIACRVVPFYNNRFPQELFNALRRLPNSLS